MRVLAYVLVLLTAVALAAAGYNPPTPIGPDTSCPPPSGKCAR